MQQETQSITLLKVLQVIILFLMKWIKKVIYYLIVGIEFLTLKCKVLFNHIGTALQPHIKRTEIRMTKRATDFFGL